MWKEYYTIGVDYIDNQHKELCDEAERLVRKVQSGDPDTKDECINAILFLKDYSVRHFAAEEEYQLSISYSDRVAHKAAHDGFVTTVLELEDKLAAADYSLPVIKEVAGFLTSWLAYHIAETDQKLKKSELLSGERTALVTSYLSCFAQSATSVLEAMVGLTAKGITFDTYDGREDDVLRHGAHAYTSSIFLTASTVTTNFPQFRMSYTLMVLVSAVLTPSILDAL